MLCTAGRWYDIGTLLLYNCRLDRLCTYRQRGLFQNSGTVRAIWQPFRSQVAAIHRFTVDFSERPYDRDAPCVGLAENAVRLLAR